MQPTPPGSELEAFYNAGPMRFTLDEDFLNQTIRPREEYRIRCGDLLELQMPSTVQIVTDELAESGRIEQTQRFLTRVGTNGTVVLPITGLVEVAGKTLLEGELAIQNAYYPRYLVSPPVIVTRVVEYQKQYVSITGAVNKPGTYSLRGDQMTLLSLLMEAGGISEKGAAVIRITNSQNDHYEENSETRRSLLMPVKGLNIPFADAGLMEGDIVEVEEIQEQSITVIGLVNKQGTYPYPVNARYTLPQALAFAGGVNETANPCFAHIYRPCADGRVYDAVVSIQPGADFAAAMTVAIKPGDVVAIEHTPQTRRNLLLADILQLRASVGVTYNQ
jgi:polysaccharide export outer membrane protein